MERERMVHIRMIDKSLDKVTSLCSRCIEVFLTVVDFIKRVCDTCTNTLVIAKESGIQVQNRLAVLLVFNNFKSSQILTWNL